MAELLKVDNLRAGYGEAVVLNSFEVTSGREAQEIEWVQSRRREAV